jgi:hypothetical protein
MNAVAVIAGIGLDPVSFLYALLENALFVAVLSSAIGRIAGALVVAVAAYLLTAAAITLVRSDEDRDRRADVPGLVLISILVAYLIASWRLDAAWFGVVSAGVLGLAVIAMATAEVMSLTARIRPHLHLHLHRH